MDHFFAGLQNQDRATQMRWGEYRDAWRLIQRYPWLGVGFGSPRDVDLFRGVSSLYLIIAESSGLVGLGAFLGLMGAIALRLTAAWRRLPDGGLRALVLGCLAAEAAALTSGVFDHYYFTYPHAFALLWLVLGLRALRRAAGRSRTAGSGGGPHMNARAPGQAAAWRLAWLLALCYALLVLASLHPYWLDLTRIDDDARAHLLPYVLPPADRLGDRLLVDYARAYVPLGYRWLFQMAAVAMAPLVFSRILGALLLTATWALAGRVGTPLGGRAGGIAGLLLAVHSAFVLENGFGGMYRGFALPLLLGWLSLMLAGRRKSAWSLLPVMALLYPQAFLVAGPAAGVDLLLRPGPGSPAHRAGASERCC